MFSSMMRDQALDAARELCEKLKDAARSKDTMPTVLDEMAPRVVAEIGMPYSVHFQPSSDVAVRLEAFGEGIAYAVVGFGSESEWRMYDPIFDVALDYYVSRRMCG